MGEAYLEAFEEMQDVRDLLEYANKQMKAIGYTEHGERHALTVARRTKRILKDLGYPNHLYELGGISGLLHDLGNSIIRVNHAETGALIALSIMMNNNSTMADAIMVSAAVGNHDETYGKPIDELTAALIIADKSDAHRSRVQKDYMALDFDIHDKVNYSVIENDLVVDPEKREITLKMVIDQEVARVSDYFNIFADRIKLCENAASVLNATFYININGQDL